MDSKREIKVGDEVLCIKEPDIPSFVGYIWKVVNIQNSLYYCTNYNLYANEFVFREGEIIRPSSLIRELL
jgi:hypothetical protein